MKRQNWPKSEKQVDNARLCSKHFVTGPKWDDPLYIDYVPTVFAFVSVAEVPWGREKVLIERSKSMKDLKNMLETRMKKRKIRLSQQEWNSTLWKCRGWEHSVPDCAKQIEFEIVLSR